MMFSKTAKSALTFLMGTMIFFMLPKVHGGDGAHGGVDPGKKKYQWGNTLSKTPRFCEG